MRLQILAIAFALVACLPTSSEADIIGPGEYIFEFTFDSDPMLGAGYNTFLAAINFYAAIDPKGTSQLSFYDSLEEGPIYTAGEQSFTQYAPGTSGGLGSGTSFPSFHFLDVHGFVKLTLSEGTLDLRSFTMVLSFANADGPQQIEAIQTFERDPSTPVPPVPVPEPTSGLLTSLAAAMMVVWSRLQRGTVSYR